MAQDRGQSPSTSNAPDNEEERNTHPVATEPIEDESSRLHSEEQQPSRQPDNEEEEVEVPIHDILSKVVIHRDRPIEHLPELLPSELKIIGRNVTFKGETKIGNEIVRMYYEGLVGTINKHTVMLIHASRFTEEDYLLRLAATSGDGGHSHTQPSNASADNNDSSHVGHSPNMSSERVSSPLLNANGNVLEASHSHIRNRMRDNTGTMGPIPFMTFSRNRIHDVEFAKDPRSTFYSLFRDPSKKHFDMQCLRMFCRRYVVHTTQGNNPRMIPLRAFVTCRCHCPDLDNDLLERVTREEIAHLVKVDREMKRAHRRKDRRVQDLVESYVAPSGIFQATGILYLLRFPQQTFLLAICLFAVTAVMVVYCAVTFSYAEKYIVYYLTLKITPYVVACGIVWFLCALASMLHAVKMHLPVTFTDYIFSVRLFCTIMGFAGGIMLPIVIGNSVSISSIERFITSGTYPVRLCSYYRVHGCSGIDVPCSYLAPTNPLCTVCQEGHVYSQAPCSGILMNSVHRTFIPVMSFGVIVMMLSILSLYTIFRLYKSSRYLMERFGH